eukprot:scaffold9427_cov175-Amphora_coffeaeformis.AAC.3
MEKKMMVHPIKIPASRAARRMRRKPRRGRRQPKRTRKVAAFNGEGMGCSMVGGRGTEGNQAVISKVWNDIINDIAIDYSFPLKESSMSIGEGGFVAGSGCCPSRGADVSKGIREVAAELTENRLV